MIPFVDTHTHHEYSAHESTMVIKNLLLPTQTVPNQGIFSAGWHPWHIEKNHLNEIERTLSDTLSHKNVIAVGECGLDRKILTNMDFQKKVFELHLNIAEKMNKPVIVHCVKAYSDLLEMMKSRHQMHPVILHGFKGNHRQIDQLLKFNVYFSIGEINEKHQKRMTDTIQFIPLDRLFIETDESFLSIDQIYQRIAIILEISIQELKLLVFQNFRTVFGDRAIKLYPGFV